MTLQEIVDQLRWCEFTCEAGKLEMNIAFRELEKLAKEESGNLVPVGYIPGNETIIFSKEVTPELLQQLDRRMDAKISAALDKYSL